VFGWRHALMIAGALSLVSAAATAPRVRVGELGVLLRRPGVLNRLRLRAGAVDRTVLGARLLDATGTYAAPWLVLAAISLIVAIALPRLRPLVQRDDAVKSEPVTPAPLAPSAID
jgi:hypothetical protein